MHRRQRVRVTLCAAWSWVDSGGQAVLLGCCEGTALSERITSEGVTYVPMEGEWSGRLDIDRYLHVAAELQDANATFGLLIALDGSQFDSDYQRRIKGAGYKLLWFDDYAHLDRYWADIVVNQNAYADTATYDSKESYVRILAGASYVALRREFLSCADTVRQILSTATKVLVTFGGADPGDGTLKVAEDIGLMRNDVLDVRIIVGAANSSVAAVCETASSCDCNIEVLTNVTNMSEKMMWADIDVGSAGTTS